MRTRWRVKVAVLLALLSGLVAAHRFTPGVGAVFDRQASVDANSFTTKSQFP